MQTDDDDDDDEGTERTQTQRAVWSLFNLFTKSISIPVPFQFTSFLYGRNIYPYRQQACEEREKSIEDQK